MVLVPVGSRTVRDEQWPVVWCLARMLAGPPISRCNFRSTETPRQHDNQRNVQRSKYTPNVLEICNDSVRREAQASFGQWVGNAHAFGTLILMTSETGKRPHPVDLTED